ncbi:hypothetical protein ACSHWB_26325 [Lentzea sp. HUAS TT2]|uniref:hypothetical protein n=1 Tax=Lentzea sp. HUAS TT2 TaxID=3447454 RepID=UPI003F703FE0
MAMRQRSNWYDLYVERPLGRKQPQVSAGPPEAEVGDDSASGYLILVDEEASRDAMLHMLAGHALSAIHDRIARGDIPGNAVQTVLAQVFSHDLPQAQLTPAAERGGDRLTSLMSDRDDRLKLVGTVLEIIDGTGCVSSKTAKQQSDPAVARSRV